MKHLSGMVGLAAFLILGVCPPLQARQEEKPVEVVLHADQTGAEINPFLYGQFIEHLGRCIYGGIWAEMLEDRKFYFPVKAEYDPYTSLKETAFPVVGASPWQIIGAAEGVTMNKEDPFVGDHSPRLAAGSGIRQRDLGLVKYRVYHGYIWLKPEAAGGSVELSLAWGGDEKERQTIRLGNLDTKKYTRYDFEFTAGEGTDKGLLEVVAKGQPARVGTLSLMPADNVRGMRADTLALLKKLGGTMYRWPGGNFVSGYDWRDGIGPRDQRPPRRNPAWTGVEHNDFGLDEFLDFCREIGTEPVIAVNTGLGDSYSAAQEVEYANGSTDTIGGSWRAKNGRAEPYKVKYWCVGNEMWGPWQLGFMQLKHYTFKHNQVADAMWRVDPSLELIGSGQLGFRNPKHDPDQKKGWSETMLAECADRMNLISEHFYRDKQADLASHVKQLATEIRQKADGERKVQDELGLVGEKRIPVAMDEWNYWHQPYLYGELGCVYDLADALGVAIGLHEYFRQSDIIEMAHYAQTVNVIGCIKTTKTEAFMDATALPLMLYRQYFGLVPIAITGADSEESLDISAAWTKDRQAITVGLVNPSLKEREVRLNFQGAKAGQEAKLWRVTGQDRTTKNEPGKENLKVIEETFAFDGLMKLPPLSFTIARVPAR